MLAFSSSKWAIITSPTATPIGLAMVSVVPLTIFTFALPPRWKMLLALVLTRIVGSESISTGEPPVPLRELVVNS